MTKQELIKKIKAYFDEHFKFQKLAYDWQFDEEAANKMSYEELLKFYEENCGGQN